MNFIEQIHIQRPEVLYRNPDTQVLRRRLRYPQTITMSAAARDSAVPEQILEAATVEDVVGLIEGFFQLEEPSRVCPRWVSRINMEVNQEAIKQQMADLEAQLKSNPVKNHVDLDRIKELRQELLADPQQPWSMAKNNFTFRNRNNYCLYCTLRDRFLNFHQSKYSAMEQEPISTDMIEIERFYKERTFEVTETSQQIIGSEELQTDNGKKVVFSLVSDDLLYSMVAFSMMLNRGNVHIVGTCSGKRFFVYEDVAEDTLVENSDDMVFAKRFYVLHSKEDAFTGKAIVIVRNNEGTLFVFASPTEFPELYDIEIMELFASIIYDYVVNGIKQEFYDSFYKQLFAFLK